MKVSFVTLVNDLETYKRNIIDTFNKFNSQGNIVVEFVPILFPDTATSGLNRGIKIASSSVIVLCHQDIVFPANWLDKLSGQITLLNDNNFGVLGTYGINYNGTDGAGNIIGGETILKGGQLPCLAMSLDEHCLIIRKNSGLHFDETLLWFHMYGADLCLTACSKGMNCYAIDAFLHHLQGTKNIKRDQAYNILREETFCKSVEWFKAKWKGKSQFKKYRTTCCYTGGIHGIIDL